MTISSSALIRFSPDPPTPGAERVASVSFILTTILNGVLTSSTLTGDEWRLSATLTIPFAMGEGDDIGDVCPRVHLLGIEPSGHAPLAVPSAGYWDSTFGYESTEDLFVVYVGGDAQTVCIDFPCTTLNPFFTWPRARFAIDPAPPDDTTPLSYRLVGEVEGGVVPDDAFDLDSLTEKNEGDCYEVTVTGYFSATTAPIFFAETGDFITWGKAGKVFKSSFEPSGLESLRFGIDKFTNVVMPSQLTAWNAHFPDGVVIVNQPLELQCSDGVVTANNGKMTLNSAAFATKVENYYGLYNVYWRIKKGEGTMVYSANCGDKKLEEIKDIRTASSPNAGTATTDLFVCKVAVTRKPDPFFIGGSSYLNISLGGVATEVPTQDTLIQRSSPTGWWQSANGVVISWSGSSIRMGARAVMSAPVTVRCACLVDIDGVEYVRVVGSGSERVGTYQRALIVGSEWEAINTVPLPIETYQANNYTPALYTWEFSSSGSEVMCYCSALVSLVWTADCDVTSGVLTDFSTHTRMVFCEEIDGTYTEDLYGDNSGEHFSLHVVFTAIAFLNATYGGGDTVLVRTRKVVYSDNRIYDWDSSDDTGALERTLKVTLSIQENDADVFSEEVDDKAYSFSNTIPYDGSSAVATTASKITNTHFYAAHRAALIVKAVGYETEYESQQDTEQGGWILKYSVNGEDVRTCKWDSFFDTLSDCTGEIPAYANETNKLTDKDENVLLDAGQKGKLGAFNSIASNSLTCSTPLPPIINIDKMIPLATEYLGRIGVEDFPTATVNGTRFFAGSFTLEDGTIKTIAKVGDNTIDIPTISGFQVTSPRACVFKPRPDLPPKPETLEPETL